MINDISDSLGQGCDCGCSSQTQLRLLLGSHRVARTAKDANRWYQYWSTHHQASEYRSEVLSSYKSGVRLLSMPVHVSRWSKQWNGTYQRRNVFRMDFCILFQIQLVLGGIHEALRTYSRYGKSQRFRRNVQFPMSPETSWFWQTAHNLLCRRHRVLPQAQSSRS